VRRTILFLTTLTILIGCGKQKPSPPDAAPAGPNTGTPKPDPNAGKPKDTAKVLTPRAVIKTGYRRDAGAGNSLFLTPDGNRLVIGLAEVTKTQIWDISGEPKKLHELPGAARAFSPDGKLFLRYGKGSGPEIASAETGATVSTLQHPGYKYEFRSPDVLVGVRLGEQEEPKRPNRLVIREYDAATGREKSNFDVPFESSVDVKLGLGGGGEVAVGFRKTSRVEIWNSSTQKKTRELTPTDASLVDFEVSPDGKWVTAARGQSHEVFDGKTGTSVFALPIGGSVGGFVPARDLYTAKYIKVVDKFQVLHGYYVFDINRKEAVAILPADGIVRAFSANGMVMATENDNGELRVWDLTQLP
jgi:WD40 repeat protein